MPSRFLRTAPRADLEAGQIMPIFAIALSALFVLAALLFDGAHALVLRRQLQDAGDAAALAAVHAIPDSGCSASGSGTPQNGVTGAAHGSLAGNLPNFTGSKTVSCAPGWNNHAVRVDLTATASTFFMGILGRGGLAVSTTSTAINGPVRASKFSIITLNPGNPSWSVGRGCPSVYAHGSFSIRLEGALSINSSCTAPNGGAFSLGGDAGTVTLLNGSQVSVVGDVTGARSRIVPAPLTGQPPAADPLSGITPPSAGSLPVRSTTLLTITTPTVLQPGIYRGGIAVKGPTFMRPGIYYIDGGGLVLEGSGQLFSVNANVTTTAAATWSTNCTAGSCGVLIYNTGGVGLLRPINLGGNTVAKLRGYDPGADVLGLNAKQYANIAVWQDASPAPTSTYAQPSILMRGNGEVDVIGTVYAPSAALDMRGNTETAGGAAGMTAQFIVRDINLGGSAELTLRYDARYATTPREYGLVD